MKMIKRTIQGTKNKIMTYTQQIIALTTQLEIIILVCLQIRRVGWAWFMSH